MGIADRRGVLSMPTPQLLSRVQAAAYIGVSPNTFDRMTCDGSMPGPKRIYARILWNVRALDRAIDRLPGDDRPSDDDPDENEWDHP